MTARIISLFNTGKVTNYTYDGLGRITKESTTGQADISYTYDDSNNRETMSVGDVTTTYKYDKDNRLLIETTIDGGISKITRYGYDGNGNQIYTATDLTTRCSGFGAKKVHFGPLFFMAFYR